MSTTPRQPVRNALALSRLAAAYVALAVMKHLVPLRTLARWTWSRAQENVSSDAERVVVARALRLRRIFTRRGDCLESSLLLYRELARVGANPVVYVGFASATLHAPGHSWVEVNGRAVAEDADEIREFVKIAGFGAHGALVTETSRAGADAVESAGAVDDLANR